MPLLFPASDMLSYALAGMPDRRALNPAVNDPERSYGQCAVLRPTLECTMQLPQLSSRSSTGEVARFVVVKYVIICMPAIQPIVYTALSIAHQILRSLTHPMPSSANG